MERYIGSINYYINTVAFSQLRVALAATLGQGGATPGAGAITPVVLASNLNDKVNYMYID